MNSFDFQSHLDSIYATYPETSHQPVIGITANCRWKRYIARLMHMRIGCRRHPDHALPPTTVRTSLLSRSNISTGCCSTGGGDYNPLWAGEQLTHTMVSMPRDHPNCAITRLAGKSRYPCLASRVAYRLAMALTAR